MMEETQPGAREEESCPDNESQGRGVGGDEGRWTPRRAVIPGDYPFRCLVVRRVDIHGVRTLHIVRAKRSEIRTILARLRRGPHQEVSVLVDYACYPNSMDKFRVAKSILRTAFNIQFHYNRVTLPARVSEERFIELIQELDHSRIR